MRAATPGSGLNGFDASAEALLLCGYTDSASDAGDGELPDTMEAFLSETAERATRLRDLGYPLPARS